MKKIILTFIAVLSFTAVSAQIQVFAKKSGKHTYYRIQRDHGAPSYAQLMSREEPTAKNLLDIDNRISAKTYQKIEEAEIEIPVSEKREIKLAYGNTRKAKAAWVSTFEVASNNRKKEILVQVNSKFPVTSSTPFKIGGKYSIFQVIEADDSQIVGCSVICQILDKRKSNINGSEGRLSLMPLYVETNDGKQIPLQSIPIMRRGLNRSNVKFWLSPLIIPIFVPGTGAKILPDETITLILE
ncbi:MAG: hypothetical protein IJ635_02920 [Bacteroidaceae bacterium]|nr:hypothetical protein [Bacteroidaceae bacterium]